MLSRVTSVDVRGMLTYHSKYNILLNQMSVSFIRAEHYTSRVAKSSELPITAAQTKQHAHV